MNPGIISILPIILVLVLAFWRRNVYLALTMGLACASIVLGFSGGSFFAGVDALSQVFTSPSTCATTFFVLISGGIMNLVERSGGIEAVVRLATGQRGLVRTPRRAQLLPALLGLAVFADGTSSISITSMSARPFFRAFGIS